MRLNQIQGAGDAEGFFTLYTKQDWKYVSSWAVVVFTMKTEESVTR